MLRRTHFRLFLSGAAFGLLFLSLQANAQNGMLDRGRKFKAPPPMARIVVTVVRADDGKPIQHAAVIFHATEHGKDIGYMELKSNEDGEAVIDVLDIGDTVELQIIARGYQTYGANYYIDKPQMAIPVRLKRPVSQYSVYQQHPAVAVPDKSTGAGQLPHPPAGAAPESGKTAAPAASSSSTPPAKSKPAAKPKAKADASQVQPK
ncbi:MAG: hypothetical protein ACP5FH_08615 [Terracidiphilus sp.]